MLDRGASNHGANQARALFAPIGRKLLQGICYAIVSVSEKRFLDDIHGLLFAQIGEPDFIEDLRDKPLDSLSNPKAPSRLLGACQ